MSNSSSTSDGESLREWAAHYRVVALYGGISLLLAIGKMVTHHKDKIPFLRVVVIPPAVIAGLIGLLFYSTVGRNSVIHEEMEEGLSTVVTNLVNYTFAGLALGVATSGSYLPKTHVILSSVWHEGLPMLVYSQVLIWGQTLCALVVSGIFHWMKPEDVSPFTGVLVTLGLETGRDVTAYSNAAVVGTWAHKVVRLADSCGLLISISLGVLLMSYQRLSTVKTANAGGSGIGGGGSGTSGPTGIGSSGIGSNSYGKGGGGGGGGDKGHKGISWLGARDSAGITRVTSNEAIEGAEASRSNEHFDMGRSGRRGSIGKAASSTGIAGLGAGGGAGGGGGGGSDLIELSGRLNRGLSPEVTAARRGNLTGPGAAAGNQVVVAGLGSHLGLLAFAVSLAFVLDLMVRAAEESIPFTAKHHVVSGFRLFRLAMATAFMLMWCLRRYTTFRYSSEWFFRLSGLCLDIVACSAITGIAFVSELEHKTSFVTVLLACLAWNAFVFLRLARVMFPNFYFSRAIACIGDALGHDFVGLLFVRSMDPQFCTPVPLAYTCKMMLFFVPASGGKNGIVIGVIDLFGIVPAIGLCACMVAAWMAVFHRYVKQLMPQQHFRLETMAKKRKEKEEDAAVKRRRRNGFDDADNDEEDGSSSVDDDRRALVVPSPLAAGSHHQSGGSGAAAIGGGGGGGVELTGIRGGGNYGQPLTLQLEGPSLILSDYHRKRLSETLPPGTASHSWKLLFSLSEHGACLSTLVHNCASAKNHPGFLIVIEDSWGWIFGGYLAGDFESKQSYYGTGESYVFGFNPKFSAYKWTGQNNLIMLSNDHCLAMGGGGGGFAFQLDDELDRGVSNFSATFGNPQLSSSEFFRCQQVEVWGAELSDFATL